MIDQKLDLQPTPTLQPLLEESATTRRPRTATAIMVLLLFVRSQPVFAQLAHWAMEPWVTTTDTLDNSLFPSSAGSDGTMIGFPEDGSEWVPGVFGRALTFDGTRSVSHAVDVAKSSGLIAHWVRLGSTDRRQVAVYEADPPGVGGDYNGFSSGMDALEIHTGVVFDQFYGVYQDGDGSINQAGSGIREVQGGTVEPGRWTHVALTWDLAGDLTLYVDCVPVDSVPMSDGLFAGHVPTERWIGRPSDGGRELEADMDEVVITDGLWDATSIRDRFCPNRRYASSSFTAPTAKENDTFGERMAAGGDTLVVATQADNELHFYRRESDANWNHDQTLDVASLPWTLDVEGTIAVVSFQFGGGVRVYEQAEGGGWGEVAVLQSEFDDFGDFGASLSIFGDRIAVGSPAAKNGGSYYLFERDAGGAQAWGRVHRQVSLTIDGFGSLVDLDGSLIAVGSFFPDESGVGLGAFQEVDLFEEDEGGPGNWGSTGTVDTLSVKADGWSLALRGDGLLVGTPQGSPSSVSVHRRNLGGANAWGLEARVEPNDDFVLSELLGGRVAWLDDDLFAASAGSVGALANPRDHEAIFLFEDLGSGTWQQREVLLTRSFLPSHEIAQQFLGYSLTGSRGVLLAGAPLNGTTIDGANAGQVLNAGKILVFALPFFTDGFESGSTSNWSSALP